jgi:ribosomal protein S18 acetylase RimI-like enzyme
MKMLIYRYTVSSDTSECLAVRGRTRENALSIADLVKYGVTPQSISQMLESGRLVGHVCTAAGSIVGFCSGDKQTGEIGVVAVLPDYEDQGIGKQLLSLVAKDLKSAGHKRLFLFCNANPTGRSHGFYRHLGWKPSGKLDPNNGDEELELL